MADESESLVVRRSRRSTAGNRMEAALAEMALEEMSKDLDDDKEFVDDKAEEDVFESDFASTDEEDAKQEDLDAGERAAQDEEQSARKTARARLERQTAAAHTRHRATFNPQAAAPPVVKPKLKLKYSPLATNSETSDALPAGTEVPLRAGQKRKSQRRHTMLNTSATVTRLKETEEKKASAPKKFKPSTRSFSQSQLIAWALDNEEGNTREHKNYLQIEEEKRKKARVIKTQAVEGPLLRWVSKIEEEKFKVSVQVTPPQPPAPVAPPVPSYASYYEAYSLYANYLSRLIATSANTTQKSSTPTPQATSTTSPNESQAKTNPTAEQAAASPASSSQPAQTAPATVTSASTSTPPATTQTNNQSFSTFRLSTTPAALTYPAFTYYTPTATTPAATSLFSTTSTPAAAPAQPPQSQYVEEERTEKVTKNYVVHELDQRDGASKPAWKEMMKAMFGDHVKWEELKVLGGKGRPLGRVKQRCPITGKFAPYLDPRTGVPFADVDAFRVLSEILDHEYMWSPELGCYVEKQEGEG